MAEIVDEIEESIDDELYDPILDSGPILTFVTMCIDFNDSNIDIAFNDSNIDIIFNSGVICQ